jgi:hypothetical protein
MNTMTKLFFVAIVLAVSAPPVFADGDGVDCHRPENVKLKNAEKKNYEDMLAHDKAGKAKQAYDIASHLDPYCISKNEQEMNRIEASKIAVLKRSSLKLGQQAESKGEFAEAYKYYESFHGIDADRAQMKLATAKPGDFETVRTGVNYFRNKQKYLSEAIARNVKTGDVDKAHLAAMNRFTSVDDADAMDPNRDARLKAIAGYLSTLQGIATKQGEKYLADEDKVFNARKTTMMAKGDTLAELNKARDWLGLFGQEKLANDRAVKRGDTLLADDSRNSLRLASSYYTFPHDDLGEKRAQKVKDKARSLGDAHLKKGEKIIAAEYYQIAGLNDKASQLQESHEAEKAKAETKRQGQFKQDQKSLEKELGL